MTDTPSPEERAAKIAPCDCSKTAWSNERGFYTGTEHEDACQSRLQPAIAAEIGAAILGERDGICRMEVYVSGTKSNKGYTIHYRQAISDFKAAIRSRSQP